MRMRLLLALLLAPAAAAAQAPPQPGALSAADLEAGIARAIDGGAAKAMAALEPPGPSSYFIGASTCGGSLLRAPMCALPDL